MAVQRRIGILTLAAFSLFGALLLWSGSTRAETSSRFFPETGHTVKGTFLNYWQEHGGLAQQGFPISEELRERSLLDGKEYTVQYFERAVLERHPENQPPYDVLLTQLGTLRYREKYGDAGAPGQQPNAQGGLLFKETGHQVGGVFLKYWQEHGGLAQQGYPVSEEFQEKSDLNGKSYTVQYFERAVFELHPENRSPYDVLLSQLGTFEFKHRHPRLAAVGSTTPQPGENPTAAPTSVPRSGATPGSGTNCQPVDVGKRSTISNTGPVAIASVQATGQERVTLRNGGDSPVDMADWVLRDKNDPRQGYTFPQGTQLEAWATIEVYTEPGHTYSFNSKSSIWNNCGDAIELLDASGKLVSTYAYGTHLIP